MSKMTTFLSFDASSETATTPDVLKRLTALGEFAKKNFPQHEKKYHDQAQVPLDNLRNLYQQGWLQVSLPEKFGGLGSTILGRDNATYLQAIRTIARYSPGTAHCLQVHNHAVWALYEEGTPEQHERFLQPLVEKFSLASFIGSEPTLRPGANEFHTKAVSDNHGFRVSGKKYYATNGVEHGFGIVFTSLDGVIGMSNNHQMVLVTPDMDGVSQEHGWYQPSGMRVAESPQITLDNVYIPPSHILGTPGAYINNRWQGRMHLGFAANYLGTAEGIFLWAVEWIQQYEDKIADQYIQLHLGEIQTILLNAQIIFEHALKTWRNSDTVQAELVSMAAKATCARAAQDLTSTILRLVGSTALFDSYPVGRLSRDLQTHILHVGYDRTYQTLGLAALGKSFDSTRQK